MTKIRFERPLALLLIAAIAMLASSSGVAAEIGVAHWSYAGDTGPQRWAELSPDYVACGIGVNQSPVDIVATVDAQLVPLEFDYRSHSTDIVNNGHTLQINAAPGSTLKIRDEIFQFEQLHFHSPSEHRIDGELFPLEAHLVHRDERGFLAVVAVLFREGAWNKELESIGTVAPEAGHSAPLDRDFETLALHRNHRSYYRYNGSLTTPPCTEGVRWYILKTAETISQEQADNYVGLIGKDARGPQPLNARLVLEH